MFGRSDYSVTVGRIAGAPVKIGPGSVVLAAFFAIQLGMGWDDRSAASTAWIIATLTGLGFMMSILIHEAAHALMARRRGVGVEEIRLWLLGGSAAMSRRAPDPTSEMLISGAGPAATLGLAALFIGAGRTVAGSMQVPYFDPITINSIEQYSAVEIGAESLFWLGAINVLLGLFNLLPALPLDGGRVLTGLLWKLRRDRIKALENVVAISKFMAYAAFGVAAMQALVWNTGVPIWTAFIGFMFLKGGQGELAAAALTRMVSNYTVADVLHGSPPVISAQVNTASARALLPNPSVARHAVVVDDDGIARGLLDLVVLWRAADADGTDLVGSIMTPIDERKAAFRTEPLSDVLDRGVLPPLVVIDPNWRPIGIVDSLQQLAVPATVTTREA